jgi:hypothetical protein
MYWALLTLVRFEDKDRIERRRRASIQCAINVNGFGLWQGLSHLGLGNADVSVTYDTIGVHIVTEVG